MKRLLGHAGKFLVSFTSIFTCVTIASSVYIWLFSNPYLPLKLIVQAGIIAAAASALNFIFYSEQPMSKKSLIARTAIHFSLLALMVTGCALYFGWFSFSSVSASAGFFGLFMAVYLIIWTANFLRDMIDERILNLKLKEYRSK